MKTNNNTDSPDKRNADIYPSEELLEARRNVVRAHVDSFNWIFESGGGLSLALQNIPPQVLDEQNGHPGARWWFEDARVAKPVRPGEDSTDNRMFPNECREGHSSYTGQLIVTVGYELSTGENLTVRVPMGEIPIMVMTRLCHLHDLTPDELVEAKEEKTEVGGYFIVNGAERAIRQVILRVRNTVISLIRDSQANFGELYTRYSVFIRCALNDQTSIINTLLYLKNGLCVLRFMSARQVLFLPVLLLLRSFIPCTDRQIFSSIVQGDTNNTFLINRVEQLLRLGDGGIVSRHPNVIISYFGQQFKSEMDLSYLISDLDAGKQFLKEGVLIHCKTGQEKFDLMIFMLRKVYALAQGKIKADNQDATNNHEVLTAGELYLTYLKERLTTWIKSLKMYIQMEMRNNSANVQLDKLAYWTKIMKKQASIGRAMNYFIATGNVKVKETIEVPQFSGFTISAEKLNFFRYLSHFRAVHRGSFFMTMRTTAVRKLRPESWGFLCPVHTPDGAPCGLLNHLTETVWIITHPTEVPNERLIDVLCHLGMTPSSLHAHATPLNHTDVILDGIVVGRIPSQFSKRFSNHLRYLKVTGHQDIIPTLQIEVVLNFDDQLFPVINLTTTPGRMVRPVEYIIPELELRNEVFSIMQAAGDKIADLSKKKIRRKIEVKKKMGADGLKNKKHIVSGLVDEYMENDGKKQQYIEWIGPREQVFMEIACIPSDFRPGVTTHKEIDPMNMISLIASLTPFSDFNQSPRNMYQCQMGKQTMATPFHSYPHRADNKFYRLGTPQKPIVCNDNQKKYFIDDYPMGTNACVAVISYTGYDMEDAMIINKSAYERGFKHGSVYKNKFIELDTTSSKSKNSTVLKRFSNEDENDHHESLGNLGLPSIGQIIKKHEPIYSTFEVVTKETRCTKHKENETCMVDEIRLIGDATGNELQTINMKLRYNRNPVIGDKFSSRHGQKGVLSVLWPQENMPFTESGMTPDIIINPHAFPSRMTIGMLIESMAGKAAALHGITQNSTPFRFHEDDPAVDYFGKQLACAGYNYYGTETMYSGISGQKLRCEIFYGLVYYQRLRHMINDKSQVRATGPMDSTTRQPVKGRKRRGGIRFGEMERDSLISHGTAFLLYDRLLMCSDYHSTIVCVTCGSLLSTHGGDFNMTCRQCKSDIGCTRVIVPYVFMYLANELAAMNIKLTLQVK